LDKALDELFEAGSVVQEGSLVFKEAPLKPSALQTVSQASEA
jgi:hypothetical protein